MDRTNVVQCFFGLKVRGVVGFSGNIEPHPLQLLEKQLLEYDLGGSSSIVSQFEDLFRTMWSRNGNNLSMWYTGSAALSKVTPPILFKCALVTTTLAERSFERRSHFAT